MFVFVADVVVVVVVAITMLLLWHTQDAQDADSLSRKSTHTVTMKKSDSRHTVTEYGHDSRTDLFQARTNVTVN